MLLQKAAATIACVYVLGDKETKTMSIRSNENVDNLYIEPNQINFAWIQIKKNRTERGGDRVRGTGVNSTEKFAATLRFENKSNVLKMRKKNRYTVETLVAKYNTENTTQYMWPTFMLHFFLWFSAFVRA